MHILTRSGHVIGWRLGKKKEQLGEVALSYVGKVILQHE